MDVENWNTDCIWGVEDETQDYKEAGDTIRAAGALQTQVLKDKINMKSSRLKG